MFSTLLRTAGFLLHVIKVYLESIYRFFVPPRMRSLTSEIILVTGSARGLGKSICCKLAEQKVTLVLWDVDNAANEATAQELKRLPTTKASIFPFHVDISSRQDVEKVAEKVKKDVGDVTVIINNAGIAPIAPLLATEPDIIEKTFQVNVLSHFWILREFLPRMIESHHGHIATVSSIGALKQLGNSVPYFGTKAAVHGYIESLKLQLRQLQAHGIRFTTIYPYFIDTEMLKDCRYSERSKWLKRLFPMLKPEYVADKLIEGIRRSCEYVYCPRTLPYVFIAQYLLPLKLRRELDLSFEQHLEHPKFPVQKIAASASASTKTN